MGEKKMIKKEIKTPSKKKVAAAAAVAVRKKSPPEDLPLPWSNYCYKRTRLIVQNVSGFGGTTKSWISSTSSACSIHHHQPKQAWPQLVETNLSPENIYYNNNDNTIYYRFEPYINVNLRASRIVIWDINIPFRIGTTNYSKSEEQYKTVVDAMVITGISSPAFAISRFNPKESSYYVEKPKWKMRDCRVTEPYSSDDRCMQFTNAIGFRGKFYAISRQGSLALIEDEDGFGNFEITALGRNRAVPDCKESRHFRDYLLEYNGEIYLVFLLSRESINVVDGVEVFELDRSRLMWEKVDRLFSDAVFFVRDKCCLGISASVLGCSRGNCVYYTHDRAGENAWFVFDMETRCISTTSGPEVDLPVARMFF